MAEPKDPRDRGADAPAPLGGEQEPIVIHPEPTGEPEPVPSPADTASGTAAASAPLVIVKSLPDDALPAGERGGRGPGARRTASAAAATSAGEASPRAMSLDALRGLFLILLTVGFAVRGAGLPDWMYHAQFPPPGDLAPVVGITWRDLAYVAFIFTMAAAIPVTLASRIARNESEFAILGSAARRFVMLMFLALLIGHANTYYTGYTQLTRGLAVVGFLVMALIYTRRHASWDAARYSLVNRAGIVAGLAFLVFSPFLYDSRFSVERIDGIITGLAFVAVAGTVVWYLTRDNLTVRLGILAAAVALYLGARGEGWIQGWWWYSPAPWLFTPSKLGLLAIAIPGTIAGDLVLRWLRARREGDDPEPAWRKGRMLTLAVLSAAVTPIAVIGLYNREVALTAQAIVSILIAGLFLTARPSSSGERFIQSLFIWGGIWLVLGLFLEPAEGGIRKVPETLTYFFTVTGLTMLVWVSLAIVTDLFGRARWTQALVDVGQNALFCYVVYSVFLNSLLEMIPPLRGFLRGSFGEVMLRTLVEVTIVVGLVRALTRRRIFWRA